MTFFRNYVMNCLRNFSIKFPSARLFFGNFLAISPAIFTRIHQEKIFHGMWQTFFPPMLSRPGSGIFTENLPYLSFQIFFLLERLPLRHTSNVFLTFKKGKGLLEWLSFTSHTKSFGVSYKKGVTEG